MRPLGDRSVNTPPTGNVFLVGMMASGKTTIGRKLAALVGFDFQDTDQLVEQRAGADISWIFHMEGEDGFRDREQVAIEQATAQTGVVLATGGGAVLRESNRRRLRERGTVVYLEAAADVIIERARRDRRRPLLETGDLPKRVEALLRERAPLYAAVAHVTVTTDRRPARLIAQQVAQKLAGAQTLRSAP